MEIKTTPTVTLFHILCEATDQTVINMIAYELACRVYVPDNSQQITFEQLLNDFGYKTIKKEAEPVKSLRRK